MNLLHHRLCRSAKWRAKLEDVILPFALEGLALGEDVLELGPGPGLTTDCLMRLVPRLTAVEIDRRLAGALSARLAGSNVSVIRADAAELPFREARFTAALSLTMLHHVPSPALQDRVFRAVARVLKPGGVFAGVDSRTSFNMRLLHIGDTLVPLDQATLGERLEKAGFRAVAVDGNAERVRFRAYR